MSAPTPAFSVKDPREYFSKIVVQNFAELEEHPEVRPLLNCIIATWHMQDWVLKHWLWERKNQEHVGRWHKLGVSYLFPMPLKPNEKAIWSANREKEDLFRKWLGRTCPPSRVIRLLTNHAKHSKRLRTREGFVMNMSGYMLGTYNHEQVWSLYEGPEDQPTIITGIYKPGLKGMALYETIEFWGKFLKEHDDWT